jgi:hypothetical protein
LCGRCEAGAGRMKAGASGMQMRCKPPLVPALQSSFRAGRYPMQADACAMQPGCKSPVAPPLQTCCEPGSMPVQADAAPMQNRCKPARSNPLHQPCTANPLPMQGDARRCNPDANARQTPPNRPHPLVLSLSKDPPSLPPGGRHEPEALATRPTAAPTQPRCSRLPPAPRHDRPSP